MLAAILVNSSNNFESDIIITGSVRGCFRWGRCRIFMVRKREPEVSRRKYRGVFSSPFRRAVRLRKRVKSFIHLVPYRIL